MNNIYIVCTYVRGIHKGVAQSRLPCNYLVIGVKVYALTLEVYIKVWPRVDYLVIGVKVFVGHVSRLAFDEFLLVSGTITDSTTA